MPKINETNSLNFDEIIGSGSTVDVVGAGVVDGLWSLSFRSKHIGVGNKLHRFYEDISFSRMSSNRIYRYQK